MFPYRPHRRFRRLTCQMRASGAVRGRNQQPRLLTCGSRYSARCRSVRWSRWLCEAGAWGDPHDRPGYDFTSVMEGEAQAHVAGPSPLAASYRAVVASIRSMGGEEDGFKRSVRRSWMRTTGVRPVSARRGGSLDSTGVRQVPHWSPGPAANDPRGIGGTCAGDLLPLQGLNLLERVSRFSMLTEITVDVLGQRVLRCASTTTDCSPAAGMVIPDPRCWC